MKHGPTTSTAWLRDHGRVREPRISGTRELTSPADAHIAFHEARRDFPGPASGMYQRTRHAIVLHSIDARANRVRRYVIALTVDATQDVPYSVTSQWGRDGWFLRDRCFRAPDADTALAQIQSTLKRRKAHGYVVTHVDDGHPLAQWLVDADMPTERLDEPPRLFPIPVPPVDDPMQGRLFR